MPAITDYTGLITSEHASAPKYIAMIAALAGAAVSQQQLVASMPAAFDVDQAIGPQLDAVGLWVGIGRNINVPINNVYFAWDTAGVGWDQGVWKGPGDPTTGVTTLDDGTYRQIIRAKIGANHWDGTLGTIVPLINNIFGSSGTYVQLTDNSDGTAIVNIFGPAPSALFMALLTGGYIPLKPAGVKFTYTLAS